jgi:hypothetical protein
MERTQLFIIVIVVAAVGLFALHFKTPSKLDDEGMPLARAGRDRAARDGTDADDANGRSVGARMRDRAGGDSARGGTSAGSERGGSDRDRHRSGGSRSAQTAIVGRGANRGDSSGTGGGRSGSGSNTMVALNNGPARGLEANEPRRSDLVQYLASQPATKPGQSSDPSKGDVALEVARPEDTDPALVKKGVAGDGSDDGLNFTKDSQLAFEGDPTTLQSGTISGTITPNWSGDDEGNNSLFTWRAPNEWSNRMELVRNGRYLRFILADSVGHESDISVPIDSWTSGQAHDFQAVYGDHKTTLIIDGVPAGQNTYPGDFNPPTAPMHVGSDNSGSSYSGADGTLKIKVMGGQETASK